MRALAVIVCAVVLALLAGCGSIGEPLYPALRIPMKATDLAVTELGNNLDITFTIPPLTVDGLPLKEIGEVELRVGPNPSKEFNLAEWAKSAARVDVPTPEKPGPVQALIPVNKFVGNEVIVAVRVTNPKGRDAGWSETKIFTVKPPLADPTNFKVVSDPKGVALSWTEETPSQVRIFRQTIQPGKPEQSSKPILLATATEPNYIDISAEFAKTYQYSIQAVAGENNESNIVVAPETVTPQDIFPPAVPLGLTASIGIGSIELAWARNTESNFKEYRILRSEENGAFVEIAHGLDAPVYSDHAIQTGKHYRYEVVAVSDTGHASGASEPVAIVAP
jgi:hypothetical protein